MGKSVAGMYASGGIRNGVVPILFRNPPADGSSNCRSSCCKRCGCSHFVQNRAQLRSFDGSHKNQSDYFQDSEMVRRKCNSLGIDNADETCLVYITEFRLPSIVGGGSNGTITGLAKPTQLCLKSTSPSLGQEEKRSYTTTQNNTPDTSTNEFVGFRLWLSSPFSALQ